MKETNSIRRKSVSGVVSYTLRTGAVYIIAVLATALLSAYLSPEQYGVFFIVTSIITFFTFLSDVGLAAALVQKREEPTIKELRTTFTVQQILAILIFGLIVVLTPVWQQYSRLNQEGLWLLYALGFSFLLASLKTIPSILLERGLDFHKLAVPQVTEQLVFYGVVVWLAYRGLGVTSFTYAVLARSIIGVVVIYAIKRWPIGLALDRMALRQLLKFGAKFQLNDLLARLKDDLYYIVLSRFLPAAQIGYLGWSKRWSMFPYQFTVQNVIAVTFPIYSRLQDKQETLAKAVEKSIFFISLVIFPILMGMAIMAWPLVVVIPAYAKWQPALPALMLFCVNVAFSAVTSPLTNTLSAMGKINATLKLMIMWTSLTWLLTPFGIRFWGYTGVAVVALLVSTSSIVAIWWVKKLLPVRYVQNLWRQLTATLVMGAVLVAGLHFWERSITWFLAGVLIGGLVYCFSLMLVGFTKIKQEIFSLKQS